jgi:hypothetical protein
MPKVYISETARPEELPRREAIAWRPQFQVRTLLGLTAFSAVAVWIWPSHRGAVAFHVFYGVLAASLAIAFVCARSGVRLLAARRDAGMGEQHPPYRMRFALFSGVFGVLPGACIWLIFVLDPFESRSRAVLAAMHALVLGVYTGPLAIVLLIGALALLRTPSTNPPLFLLCVLGLVVNVAPIVVFAFYGHFPL